MEIKTVQIPLTIELLYHWLLRTATIASAMFTAHDMMISSSYKTACNFTIQIFE